MTEGFGPKVSGFDHFKFGDHKSLKKAIKEEVKNMEKTRDLYKNNDLIVIEDAAQAIGSKYKDNYLGIYISGDKELDFKKEDIPILSFINKSKAFNASFLELPNQ